MKQYFVFFLAVLCLGTALGQTRFVQQPPQGGESQSSMRVCSQKQATPEFSQRPQRSHSDAQHGMRSQLQRSSAMGKLAACSSAEFAGLSGSAFSDAVASSTDACLGNLWTFDGNAAIAVDESHVLAVINALNIERGDLVNRAARVEQYLYYLQIAYYHEFYQSGVNYSAGLNAAAQSAVALVGSESAFYNENADMADLRYRWSIAVDSVSGTIDALGAVENLLIRYRDNAALAGDWYERSIAFNLFFSLSRQVGNFAYDGAASPWYNAVPASLLNVTRDLAVQTSYNSDTVVIVNNAIYTLGNFSALNNQTRNSAHAHLSQAFTTHVDYSQPWLRAVTDLDTFYDGSLANGTVLDMESIRADVKNIALPNSFSYAGGQIVFECNIPKSTADLLYDAIAEVRSQFFRKATYLDPVPNDPNDALILTIYASPADYQQFQPFLYGLNTNNGGIYIEQWGNLFTYERTPQDSYLTLEELLRHEYVHYLDARFLIWGDYYELPIYDNDRLTWYNEGLAEFLVGSTRDRQVLPRSLYIDQIDRDSSRMTVYEILNASYDSGFRFYTYAGVFFNFLDTQRPDLLAQVFEKVRNNDPSGLDNLYASMWNDSNVQAGYSNYIDARINELNNNSGTWAEDFATVRTPSNLPGDNAANISNSIQLQGPGAGSLQVLDDRYRFTGSFSLNTGGANEAGVRDLLEARMDQLVDDLTPMGANFTSCVTWFGNHSVSGNSVSATYVVEGPYSGTGNPDTTPPAAPSGLAASGGDQQIGLSWNANSETDLAGYQVFGSDNNTGPFIQLTTTTTATSYTETGLGQNTTRYYVVRAVDQSGNASSDSAIVSATTDAGAGNGGPPATPTGIVATGLNGAVSLTWNANTEADLAGYQIWRSEPGTAWQEIDFSTTPSYNDGGLVAGNTYYYLLRAENTGGQVSGWSDYAYAVPLSGPTPKVLVVNGNYNSSTTYVAGITTALDGLGIAYDTWTIASEGSPTASDLSAYTTGMVLWSVGYFYNGYDQLGSAQEAAIKSYLDAGGNLLMCGAYATAYRGGTDLFVNYIHATHVGWSLSVPEIVPTGNGPITSTGSLSFDSDYYQSELDITAPAVAGFTWDASYGENQSSGTCLLTVEDGYKLVYLSYPIYTMNETAAKSLIEQSINWMSPTLLQ